MEFPKFALSKGGAVNCLLTIDTREARVVTRLSTYAFVAVSVLAMGFATFRFRLDPIALSKPESLPMLVSIQCPLAKRLPAGYYPHTILKLWRVKILAFLYSRSHLRGPTHY